MSKEYTVDSFIEECRKQIGKEVNDPWHPPTNELANIKAIDDYAAALGDKNPLFLDDKYAKRTKYKCLIAHPTFLITVRHPASLGATYDGPYPLAFFFNSVRWEWVNVIRMNDRFSSSLVLKDVYEKDSKFGRQVYLVSEVNYWNNHEDLIAKGTGSYVFIERKKWTKFGFRDELIYDRPVYCYTEEESRSILKDIRSEVRRGSKPLNWEDVNVGDEVPPVVKGPMTEADLMSWYMGTYSCTANPPFRLGYVKVKKYPGIIRTNRATRWPYDNALQEHFDPKISAGRGISYMFDTGTMRICNTEHLLSNWMGDDGFLRMLDVEIKQPFLYGDTLWITGQVTKKYRDKVGDVEYGAVDIKIDALNQLKENTLQGTATIYLPFPGQEVKIPIPT